MKKKTILFILLITWTCIVQAANLLEVYRQAELNDPIFQQAIANTFATKEGVPISIAALLPNIAVQADPSITRSAYAGSLFTAAPGTNILLSPRNNTARAYTLTLTAQQTVFNFAQFVTVAAQLDNAKSANAKLNAALQDLMIRVAKAYFAILQDEETLKYNQATKLAYAQQLSQAKHQYRVGLKTLTEVYTAQASYDSAVADYIAAQTTLANDRENLRAITGIYYAHLATLSQHFPLVSPQPHNVESWVATAMRQNWSIKASQYAVEMQRQIIKQQFAGHLPTINVQGTLNRLYSNNINGYNSISLPEGPGTQTDREIALNINVPLFSGGGVTAQTNQAIYQFRGVQQQLEQTMRDTINLTHQSYLNILAGISKIMADKQA